MFDYVVVDQDDRHESYEPHEILRCHYFVKHDKAPGLNEESCEQVVIKCYSTHKNQRPLRDESEDADSSGAGLFEKLVDQIPVYTIVVAMVLSDKMVQVGFIEVLISINGVKSGSQPEESNASPKRKTYAVPCEKSILRYYRFVGTTAPCNKFAITIYEKVKDEAEDNWVDLEVDCQAKEETPKVILTPQNQVDRYVNECLDDLVV